MIKFLAIGLIIFPVSSYWSSVRTILILQFEWAFWISLICYSHSLLLFSSRRPISNWTTDISNVKLIPASQQQQQQRMEPQSKNFFQECHFYGSRHIIKRNGHNFFAYTFCRVDILDLRKTTFLFFFRHGPSQEVLAFGRKIGAIDWLKISFS